MQPSIQMLAQGEIEQYRCNLSQDFAWVAPFSTRRPRLVENLCTIEKPQVREIAADIMSPVTWTKRHSNR
ncbi:MAG: hypothetical protein V2J65_29895 [Desulfobacteraceae bacterium]|jgi:hypothetical protein|nr:hypothetical protein [Desulfobacteraceae bacterium]